ncbi:MAG TPA: GntR family transcriptional regulator [Firmicutes bacterium]|nr:GntR family transcriptional regulator [Candidatus Fermentithermobacillaceae bacterium]
MLGMVDRTSPVPLYYQIAQALRERIKKGEWLPGHRVPPEHELTQEFGVSRHTIRQALASLERDGLIYRQAGLGTFVRSEKYSYPLSFLQGFTEQMEERGLKPSSRVLTLQKRLPEPFLRSSLALPVGREVYELKRLRLANCEPIALETMFLPVTLVPGLEQKDLEKISIYRFVEDDLGLKIIGATQTIEAERPPEDVARFLGLPVDGLTLRMKNVTYLENMRPLCFVDCYYRADRYIFTVSMPRRKTV